MTAPDKNKVYIAIGIVVFLCFVYVGEMDRAEEESKEVEESSIETQDSRPYVTESSEKDR